MSTTTTAVSTNPTAARYQCGSGCGTLTFTWDAKVFPGGGRTGKATLGRFVNKPIQVYDAKPILYNGVEIGTNWGFQAQDGSFVCRMYVSADQNTVNFVNCRPYGGWPLTSCFAL